MCDITDLVEKLGEAAGQANSNGDRIADGHPVTGKEDAAYHYGRKDAFDEALRMVAEWSELNRSAHGSCHT